ncbi:MAG: anthranilate synthase component I family protein [Eubacterium sp.]|nr:anthranilate synthase component I family protein [Eubacterium sp.]
MKNVHYIPDQGELDHLLACGKYKRIPLAREIYEDAFTPVEVVRILRNASRHCFLFESAEREERWGRYSFLGFQPDLDLTCTDGHLVLSQETEEGEKTVEEKQVEHPGDAIRQLICQYNSPVVKGLPPFTGGLVGYFSYDYIKYAEPNLNLSAQGNGDFLDVDLMLFNDIIAFDNYRQKIYVISGILDGDVDKAKTRIDDIVELLRKGAKNYFPPLSLESEITPFKNEEQFVDMVNKAKNYIREGDIFQVVLSNPMTAKASGSLFDTYRVLRATNPSPYMIYMSSENIEVAASSPETLARFSIGDGRKVFTFPLAGTRPRGKTPEEDKEVEKGLLADDKELAEHNMLVDLGRNDIGRISEIGTVKVEKYMEIERFSHVMHIGSTVTGRLRENLDAVSCVDSILPAGTLSGAPKFRACQIIEELEGRKRGLYGGAIGYIDFSGNLDVCIAIRLVYKKNGQITIQSGAGIVADSDPLKEEQECRNKAAAVVEAVKAAEGGLE